LPDWLNKVVQPLWLPVMAFAFTFLAAPYFKYLPDAANGVFEAGPYWIALITLVLAVAFNRTKIALFTLVLLGGFFVRQQASDLPLWQFVVYGLVPLNLALISCYQERGLLTLPGYIRLGSLGLQAGLLVWLAQNSAHLLDPYLHLSLADITQLISQGLQHGIDRITGAAVNDTISAAQSAASSATQGSFSTTISRLLAPLHLLETILLGGAAVTLTIASWRINTPVSYALFGGFCGYLLIILSQPAALLADAYMLTSLLLLCAGLLRDSYNMAYRDELTGLPQRRALNEQLQTVGKRYSLAMLDVDHFKKFNDTHGHDVGDQVLQMVASRIRKVRGGGRAFRYGGEEFAVVFHGKDKTDAAHYLEQVRKSIADYEMVIREDEREEDLAGNDKQVKGAKVKRQRGSYHKASKKVSVTISIGVAERSQRGQTPEEVLKLADEALYKAKGGGRNQVAIAD
jgi:diguanylate cyclase (GGDEF)-like protein